MDDLHDQTYSSDDVFEPNTLDDEDEWKDVEPETFGPSFLSFGGNSKYRKMEDFLEDARDVYGVDLIHIKNTHGMFPPLAPSISGEKEVGLLIGSGRLGYIRDDQIDQLRPYPNEGWPVPP